MKRLYVLAVLAALAATVLPAEAASPPRKEIAALKRQVAALKAQLTTAQKHNKNLGAGNERLLRENVALRARVAQVDPCPITKPNGSAPPGTPSGSSYHGNASLTVALWGSNVVVGTPDMIGRDGSIDAKFGWWRGVRGELTIEGRRLDAPAPPLRADIPSGYGETGLQATGIIFPTEGCWEVTGRVGGASLTFVTLVLRA